MNAHAQSSMRKSIHFSESVHLDSSFQLTTSSVKLLNKPVHLKHSLCSLLFFHYCSLLFPVLIIIMMMIIIINYSFPAKQSHLFFVFFNQIVQTRVHITILDRGI